MKRRLGERERSDVEGLGGGGDVYTFGARGGRGEGGEGAGASTWGTFGVACVISSRGVFAGASGGGSIRAGTSTHTQVGEPSVMSVHAPSASEGRAGQGGTSTTSAGFQRPEAACIRHVRHRPSPAGVQGLHTMRPLTRRTGSHPAASVVRSWGSTSCGLTQRPQRGYAASRVEGGGQMDIEATGLTGPPPCCSLG